MTKRATRLLVFYMSLLENSFYLVALVIFAVTCAYLMALLP